MYKEENFQMSLAHKLILPINVLPDPTNGPNWKKKSSKYSQEKKCTGLLFKGMKHFFSASKIISAIWVFFKTKQKMKKTKQEKNKSQKMSLKNIIWMN